MAGFKHIGITAKLVIAVVASSIAIYLVVFGIGYSLTDRVISQNVNALGESIVASTVERIAAVPEEISRAATVVNLMTEHDIKGRDDIYLVLELILKNNRDIFGVSVSYEPYTLDPREKFFSPYCFRKEGEIRCRMLKGDDYDYFSMDWYAKPRETGRSFWSEPFTDPFVDEIVGGEPMLSHSEPIYRVVGGERVFHGVVCADISIAWLQRMISELVENHGGYSFLVSRDGRFVTFPGDTVARGSSIRDFPGAEAIAAGMTSGGEGAAAVADFISGEDSWVFYRPVPKTEWSMGVVFPERELVAAALFVGRRMLALCLAGTILLFGVVLALSRRITRPLDQLALAAGRISRGDLDAHIPAAERGDEVGRLAAAFSKMQMDLRRYIEEISRRIAGQQRIEDELRIAHEIQQSIVPRTFGPMGISGNVAAFGTLVPAREIGGDLFDCFDIDRRRVCFVVGDVSDKGVHAALVMAIISSLMRTLARNLKHQDDLLRIVNRAILRRTGGSMFVTLFCGILDSRTGRFRYANAGHPDPVLIRRGEPPRFLSGRRGKALGVDMDVGADTPWNDTTLSEGDVLFMCTDGITEAVNEREELFGEQRLLDLLQANSGCSPERIVGATMEEVRRFAGSCPLPDDIALLCSSYAPFDPWRMSLSITNDLSEIPGLAAAVADFCASMGLDDEFVRETNLAVEEVVANIIRFAYGDGAPHRIGISLAASEDRITVTISDNGRPFDPLGVPLPDISLPLTERPVGGLGLTLVRRMTDSVTYERVGGSNALTLVKLRKGG